MREHGFTFFPSYFRAINRLDDADRLAVYDALMRYAFNSEEPEGLSPALTSLLDVMRPNVDSSISRYEASVANGKLGGRPPKNRAETEGEPSHNLAETQTKPSHKQETEVEMNLELKRKSESEEENDWEEEGCRGEETHFPPLTDESPCPHDLTEVTRLFRERAFSSDPRAFFKYYLTRNWCDDDGEPVRSWVTLAEHWEMNNSKPIDS